MKLQILCLLALCVAASVANVAPAERSELAAIGSRAVEALADTAASFNDNAETVNSGLELMRDFIEIFNSNIFEKMGLNPLLELVSKILTFTITLINLIQGIGAQESAEMKFMREQFALLHAKLDSISLQLDDVKRLIEWQTTRAIYAQYENSIAASSRQLTDYIKAPASQRDVTKRVFVTNFAPVRQSTLKLYLAVAESDFVISSNLAAAVVHYTQNHRRHTMNFLLAMQRLIMRGAQLEISYERMANGANAAAVIKATWDGRMRTLLTRMQKVEIDVKNRFQAQMESDVDRFVLDQRALSNQDFSGKLYNLVAGKFDWRFWFTLAYENVSGSDKHTVSTCGGFFRFRTHGNRNMAVASSNPKTTRFTQAKGNAALDAAQREGSGTHAEGWMKLIRSKIGSTCEDAAFVGAICYGCNVWFTSITTRRSSRVMNNRGNIHTVVFG